MSKDKQIIVILLKAMHEAIENGDWSVDGRCDPEMVMVCVTNYLLDKGIDWKKEDDEPILMA